MRLMLVVSYDGSKFHGFQRQKNVKNVQGYLEEGLSKLYQQEILVKGAGRTDAYVHAKYQVVHFDCAYKIKGLKKKLNKLLPDIYIRKVKVVNEDFHARHSVYNKTYLYKIDLSLKKDENYYLRVNHLNIKKMQEASRLFIGTHDFRAFVAGERINYITTIDKIKIYKIGTTLYLKFTGKSFYRYMVRNLVGALILVGKDKIDGQLINDMLNNKTDRRLDTSSPKGLYLVKIRY